MRIIFRLILLYSFLILQVPLYSQIVFTPLNSPVYNFLDHLGTEHIINLADEVKPYSRLKIAGYLRTAENDIDKLNKTEMEELKWYKEEYANELNYNNERWFLYHYSDSLFSIRVSPIGGYGISRTGNSHGHTR